MDTEVSDVKILASPVRLPCGVQVHNRLVKVAMYEHLSPLGGGPPNEKHLALYSTWAQGNWGTIITGNVQVSSSHLSLGADIVLPPLNKPYDIKLWQNLAAAMHAARPGDVPPIALMQLNHTGRQSPRFVGGRSPWKAPLAPSAKRVGSNVNESWFSRMLYKLLFHQPREMTTEDIERTVAEFCFGAKIAMEAGFDGVQLHGSHGSHHAVHVSQGKLFLPTKIYTLMVPKTNLRTDEYSDRLLFLKQIAIKIRHFVPASFVLALKLNAADYVLGGMTEAQSLEHLTEIAQWKLFDIIEVSGGDYENPEFVISNKRQAFFAQFSRDASAVIQKLNLPQPPVQILLTGSLRGRIALASAVRNKHASLVGLARPSVVQPMYPRVILDDSISVDDIPFPFEPSLPKLAISKLAGGSVGTIWYCYEMMRIAGLRSGAYTPSGAPAVWRIIYLYIYSLFFFIRQLVI